MPDFEIPSYGEQLLKNLNLTYGTPRTAGGDWVGRGSTNFGESQYDDNALSPYARQTQAQVDRYRAFKQPWYDQLGNQAVKTGLGIGLELVDFAGLLGELALLGTGLESKYDFDNWVTSLARKGKESLNEALPVYREDPNDITDFSDPAWWIEHGGGLIQSISSFMIGGSAVGKVLGNAARYAVTGAAAKSMHVARNANIYKNIGQGLAQGTTAGLLTYTEGAMEAADVYKHVLEASGGNLEKASEAAATTVKWNMMNTMLNLTALSPMFKRAGNFTKPVKATRAEYLAKLGFEGTQEGLEEVVNLWARGEGEVVGGVKKNKGTGFDRFLDALGSEEGALNFGLGFIGGVGQKAGMGKLVTGKYKDDSNRITDDDYAKLSEKDKEDYEPIVNEEGNKEWFKPITKTASLDDLEFILANKEYAARIGMFKQDVNRLDKLQADLVKAAEAGDKQKIELLQGELFHLGMSRSIRGGMSDQLIDQMEKVASVDNTKIGEDGKTDAQRKGLAESTEDNQYKEKAAKAVRDIKQLSKEFDSLSYLVSDPFSLHRLFDIRVNEVHHYNTKLEESAIKYNTELAKSLELVADKDNIDIVELAGKDISFAFAKSTIQSMVEDLKKNTELTAEEKKDNIDRLENEIKQLDNARQINKSVLDTRLKETNNKRILEENKGVLNTLVPTITQTMIYERLSNQAKLKYNQALGNQREFEQQSNKIFKAVVADINKRKEEKQRTDQTGNQIANAEEHKEKLKFESVQDEEYTAFTEKGEVTPERIRTIADKKKAGKKLTKREKEIYTAKEKEILDLLAKENPGVDVVKESETAIEVGGELYNGLTVREDLTETELTSIEDSINKDHESTNRTEYNTIRYQSQPTDTDKDNEVLSPISDKFKINHSPKLKPGTTVVLRVDEEYKDESGEPAIGIYLLGRDKSIGTIGINNADPTEQLKLQNLRDYVLAKGRVTTTILSKTTGKLAKTKKRKNKRTSREVFKSKVEFGIGVAGNLVIDDKTILPVDSHNIIPDGFVHVVVVSPTGTRMAYPLDTNRVSEEIADSIVEAFFLMVNKNKLSPEDSVLLDELSETINLTTMNGFREYVSQFVYLDPDLKDSDRHNSRILDYNNRKTDRYFMDISPTGIAYLKPGEIRAEGGVFKPWEIRGNAEYTAEEEAKYRAKLKQIIMDRHMRMDKSKIKDNKKVETLVIKRVNGKLTYTKQSKTMYDYILDNTSTNIVSHEIGKGEYTYFLHPTIKIDTSFLYKEKEAVKIAQKNLENHLKTTIIDASEVDAGAEIDPLSPYNDINVNVGVGKPTNPTVADAKKLEDGCNT